MSQLLEYISHHPWLTSVTGAALLAVTLFELREKARAEGAISPQEVVRLINQGATVIDVRDAASFSGGHIRGARNMPGAELAGNADSIKRLRERPVVVVCERGVTGAAAMRELVGQGFTKVANLRGGLAAWRAEQLPLTRE
jgi:rhodanese-related sulfurtransferase